MGTEQQRAEPHLPGAGAGGGGSDGIKPEKEAQPLPLPDPAVGTDLEFSSFQKGFEVTSF